MKKIISLLGIVTLCLFALGSCNDPVEETPTEKPSLELLSTLVTAEAEGGEMTVGFVINNPDDSSLEGRCADNWCHDFFFPEDGVMKFTVDANDSNEPRITSIYIRYGTQEKKFTLSQTGYGEDPEAIATMDFDIRYDINGPEVKMTIVPEFDYVRYYFAYSTQEDIDNIGADKVQAVIKANVQSFLQGEVNAMVSYSGYTVIQALDEYTGYGTRTASMTINARTDYVGWACAISNDVTVISDVVMKPFRTGDVPPSDNQLSINIEQVNCDRVSFSINTTNEDQYAVYILPAEQVEAMTDDEIVELFNTSDDVTRYLQFGDYAATQMGLSESTDYYVLAYGYKWGMATTEINKQKFRTIAYEDGGIPEFEFNVAKIANISISGTIECSSSTALYYTDYCDAEYTAEEILEELEYTIDWYVNSAGYYPNRISLMRVIGTRGDFDFNYADEYIVPNSSYKLYAIAIDEATGEFSTDVIFSEVIATPDVADVTVNSYYNHFFDAAQVALEYPETGYDVAYMTGFAVMPLLTESNDEVADFYVDIFTDDLSNTNYPTDDQLFNALYEAGQHNISPTFILCNFYDLTETPLTICSVAIDKQGNRGPVTRKVIELHYSDCADTAEFEQYLVQESQASQVSQVAKEQGSRKCCSRLESLLKKDNK